MLNSLKSTMGAYENSRVRFFPRNVFPHLLPVAESINSFFAHSANFIAVSAPTVNAKCECRRSLCTYSERKMRISAQSVHLPSIPPFPPPPYNDFFPKSGLGHGQHTPNSIYIIYPKPGEAYPARKKNIESARKKVLSRTLGSHPNPNAELKTN